LTACHAASNAPGVATTERRPSLLDLFREHGPAFERRHLLSPTQRGLSARPASRRDVAQPAHRRNRCSFPAVLHPGRHFFKRTEQEGRALLQTAFQQPGDLIVDGLLLRVRFAPLSAQRFTLALQRLCAVLNDSKPYYPESPYRLHFERARAALAALGI
jgi:hypothetical protein